MNIKKLAGAVAATAITFSVGAVTVAPASAVDNIKPFGSQERLNDWGTGGPMIGYTVTGLNPSSDAVPHNGQLYEATVTVDAFGSWAIPVVPMFNARAEGGQNYGVLADAGVNRGVDLRAHVGVQIGVVEHELHDRTPGDVLRLEDRLKVGRVLGVHDRAVDDGQHPLLNVLQHRLDVGGLLLQLPRALLDLLDHGG